MNRKSGPRMPEIKLSPKQEQELNQAIEAVPVLVLDDNFGKQR